VFSRLQSQYVAYPWWGRRIILSLRELRFFKVVVAVVAAAVVRAAAVVVVVVVVVVVYLTIANLCPFCHRFFVFSVLSFSTRLGGHFNRVIKLVLDI